MIELRWQREPPQILYLLASTAQGVDTGNVRAWNSLPTEHMLVISLCVGVRE